MHKIHAFLAREERPTVRPSPSRQLVAIGRIERLSIEAIESIGANDLESAIGAMARIRELARDIGR
jgi:hypothetical protein